MSDVAAIDETAVLRRGRREGVLACVAELRRMATASDFLANTAEVDGVARCHRRHAEQYRSAARYLELVVT